VATFNKFYPFVDAVSNGYHNLGADILSIALLTSAGTPSATYSGYSQISGAEIDYTNLSGQATALEMDASSSTQTSGVYTLVLPDLTLTASGAIPSFRYIVLYNKSVSGQDNNLIGWWDYGASVTMQDTTTFLVDFQSFTVKISG